MSILDKQTPSQLSQGINKGFTFQQPNQVTFALNAIRDAHDGGKPEYQSEPGNEVVESLPVGYSLAGHIYGINNEVYLLGVRNEIDCLIGIFKNGKFTTHVDIQGLGFSVDYPITGEFRIRKGCERVIYWNDGNSDDKWYNFDDPDSFKTATVFDPNKFKFNPIITVPKIDLTRVNDTGGNLALGSYYFQLELLDDNENLIYKTDITPQVVIYDDNQSDAYNKIDGGLNYPQYDTAIGGLPATNKSITFRFHNLDTSFAFLRVNVARQLVGTQVIDAHSVSQLVPITGLETEWTYRGYDVNGGDYPIDYSSMLVDTIRYASSYVMEQVQGRLLRANVKQQVRDYSQYQSTVSQITAKWTTDIVTLEDANEDGSPKNPSTYWLNRGAQGDEIYLPGIRFLHTDGTWSPVFICIGRNSTSDDTELLTVVMNATSPLGASQVWLSDVEHLPQDKFDTWVGTYIGSTIQKWKVFNTAIIDGTFGYYEAEATYPDIRDCDDNIIWGNDADGLTIDETTKIRLFRFPDRKMFPHYYGEEFNAIIYGIQFDNIVYPSTDIVGHQFCYAERDELNKTVIDSGWMVKPSYSGGIIENTPYFTSFDQSHNYARFNSAEVFFNNNIMSPDYIVVSNAYRIESVPKNLTDFSDIPATRNNDDFNFQIANHHTKAVDYIDLERTNYKVVGNVFVEINSYIETSSFSAIVDNQTSDYLSPDNMLELNYELPNLISDLGSNNFGLNTADPSYMGFNVIYCYKKKLNSPYENIFNLKFNYLDHNYNDSTISADNRYYGFDTLISLCAPARSVLIGSSIDGDDVTEETWELISYTSFYEERQINSSLRHSGSEPLYYYYKADGDTKYILKKFADFNTANRWDFLDSEQYRPEYYSVNKDYTLQAIQKNKAIIPFNYDYCSECVGRYTNRIVFSPKSFDEELFDLYRINYTDDYIDIPGHRGAITGIKYYNNQLIIHCEDSSFILEPNPRGLSTSAETVYLTTGDFLSIPPNEMIQTDIGYAGCQNKQHQCDTPFGHCWIDQRRGQVFQYSGQLKPLSDVGNMTQWFKEYLPSETEYTYYQVYETSYPHTSTINPKGHGIIMYYDPRFKRLIISKKDYLPLNLSIREPDSTGDLYFDPITDTWQSYNSGIVEVSYGNTTNFERKSWTLSFGFEYDSWISWHSYIPVYAFADEMHYYTSTFLELANNNIWRHKHNESFQKYYNIKYDMIIEWMIFDVETDTFYGVNYTGYSLQWDSTNKQWKPVDATFNKGIFYNFDQSSGLVNLTLQNQHTNPYQNVTLPVTTKYVIKTDQNYKISGIYDIATGSPVMSNDWAKLKLYNGYIDLVPNTDNLDATKASYYTGNLWDKFIINRLYYKPTQDYKKVIILSSTKEYKSIR